MNTLHEFKVIDFAERRQQKREEKAFKKRYDHIKSFCEFGNVELFDALIDEVEITDDSIRSLGDFVLACQRRSVDPTELFDQAILLHDDDYHSVTGYNWWIAIEETLTYYALLKKEDELSYRKALTYALMVN